MVPLIAATALSINVFIISKQGDGHDVFHVKPLSSDNHTNSSILLYKNGEHCDAIIPFVKHCDQNWFHDTNRIKDVFLNTYVGTNKPNSKMWRFIARIEMKSGILNLTHLSWSLKVFWCTCRSKLITTAYARKTALQVTCFLKPTNATLTNWKIFVWNTRKVWSQGIWILTAWGINF